MALVDPYAPAYQPPFDAGTDLGAMYQQDAQNKIAQAKVAERKSFTSGLAGKYGINDVSAKVKGLSDSDLYDLAVNLVTARRKAAGASTAPGTPAPAPKPSGSGTKAPAPKATTAPKAVVPKVVARRRTTTAKTTATTAAKAPAIRTPTARVGQVAL